MAHQLFMRRPNLADLAEMPPLPPGFGLRPAQSDDDRAIADVMISAFGPDWSVERVRQALLDAEDVKETFVVTAHGTPVATASARLMPDRHPGSGYVHWVASHPDHRGNQLGKIATLAVLRSFRELACRDAVLETDPPRLPAIRLYLSLGFLPETRVPEHEGMWQEVFNNLSTVGVSPPRAAPS